MLINKVNGKKRTSKSYFTCGEMIIDYQMCIILEFVSCFDLLDRINIIHI